MHTIPTTYHHLRVGDRVLGRTRVLCVVHVHAPCARTHGLPMVDMESEDHTIKVRIPIPTHAHTFQVVRSS